MTSWDPFWPLQFCDFVIYVQKYTGVLLGAIDLVFQGKPKQYNRIFLIENLSYIIILMGKNAKNVPNKYGRL